MFISRENLKLTTFTMAAASLLLVACTTVTTQGFRTNANSKIESSQTAIGANFSKYDQLTTEGMGIYFPPHAEPSKGDQQRIRQIFRTAFLGELEGYSIVEGSGPTTLLVKASLIDYRKSSSGDALLVRRDLRDIANPGSMIFLMELVDSETGQILGRGADSTMVPSFATLESTSTDWEAVELAAKNWAVLFRQFLDEYLNK
jgi:hypothetical protein